MSPRVPSTPGQKAVARDRHVKLLNEAKRFGVGNVVAAVVYEELSKKLPILATVEKLDATSLHEAVTDGFERAWKEFQDSTKPPDA